MTRLATVEYLNAAPLHEHLDRARYEVVKDIPSRIATLLKDGTVDIALVPVAAALSDAAYRIVPGVAIGSDGPVESVLLVSETPPAAWTEVLLDGESRTSAVLATLLLREYWGRPDIQIRKVPAGEATAHAAGRTAALVIGDRARTLPERFTTRIDLGEAWKEWTGLPFVFAVWAGRPDLDPAVIEDLRDAARTGLAAVPRRYSGADLTYLTKHIRHGLGDRELMGLRRFAALGRKAGLLGTRDVILYGPSQRSRTRADVDVLLGRAADGQRLDRTALLEIATHARIADLGAAADLRRRALHPENQVRVTVAQALDIPGLFQGSGTTGTETALSSHEAWLVDAESADAPLPLSRLSSAHRQARAFTPTTLAQAAQSWGISLRSLAEELRASGVSLLPGRMPTTEPDAWLRNLSVLHEVGLKTIIVVEIGTGESWSDRIDQLLRLRALGTGISGVWFEAAAGMRADGGTATDLAAMTALARLTLDEVPDIYASAQALGTTQTLLHMGANKVTPFVIDPGHPADEHASVLALLKDVERNIEDAGFTAVVHR